jgi:glycosyltransferase involved in cell wall biosynthesis
VTRLLLCTQPTDGGVGRHVRDLLNNLGGSGWEVVLCAPAVPSGVTAPVSHVPLDLGRALSPRDDLAAVARLSKIVQRVRPQIVHAHSSKAGAIARLARVSHPRTPVVYTPHGYAFAGYFSGGGERLLYRGIERALAPLSSRVVCVCEAEAELARSVGPSARVRIVHNGIEPAHDGPLDSRIEAISARGPVIGALSLLRPGKGLETLIDALVQVHASHPNAQLAIYGEGPDLQALLARARMRGVDRATHFLGPTADPMAALRAIDVFVHPSWAEAFPYVILEAMSAGRPIVASDVGGVREALVDGESGLLVPARDSGALARVLTGLLDDPRRGAEMGEMARQRAASQFTLSAMIDRLVDVYDELMRSAPREDPNHHAPVRVAAEQPPRPMTGSSRG